MSLGTRCEAVECRDASMKDNADRRCVHVFVCYL